MSGESADKVKQIFFDQVDIQLNKTTTIPGGEYDRRPASVEPFVSGSTSAFYLDKATGITIRNSSVAWGKNKPAYFSSMIENYAVNDLQVVNLTGGPAFPATKKGRKK